MNDLNTKEVSDICVSCGMCCDGTLFMFGNIINENDKQNVVNKGIEVEFQKDKWVFKQPCAQFKGCCQIYSQTKPNVCNSFFCDPLKNAKNGYISIEVAENQILKAKKLSIDLKNEYDKYVEFEGLEWHAFFKRFNPILEESNPSELKKYGFLLIKFLAYKNAINVVYSSKPKKDTNMQFESVVK
jgi:uncharacterized protein